MPRILGILVGLSFVNILMGNIVLPTYIVIQQLFQLQASELGLLIALPSLSSLLTFLLVGRLSDRFGRRPVILCGLALLAVSYFAGYEALTFRNIFVLIAARLLQGLGEVATFPNYLAVAGEMVHSSLRQSAMGWIESVTSLGGVIGPPLSGFVLGFGNASPYAMNALIAAIALGIAALGIPSPPRPLRKASLAPTPSQLPKRPHRVGPYINGLISLGALVAVQGFLGLLLFQRFNISTRDVGWLLALVPSAMAVGSLVVSIEGEGPGGRGVRMQAIGLAGVAGILLIGSSTSLVLICIGLLLIGFAIGIWLPYLDHDISATSLDSDRGRRLTTLHGAKTLGSLLVPTLFGSMLQAGGFQIAYSGLALTVFAAGSLAVLVTPSKLSKPERP